MMDCKDDISELSKFFGEVMKREVEEEEEDVPLYRALSSSSS